MTDTTDGKHFDEIQEKAALHEFQSMLRALRFVERDDVPGFRGDHNDLWVRFRSDPTRYLIVCPEEIALQIWRAMQT